MLDDSLPLQSRVRHCADCSSRHQPARLPARRAGQRGAGRLFDPADGARARTSAAAPAAIDVHHHVSPPAWLTAVRAAASIRSPTNWSVQNSLDDMDRGGVATSILSITTPGVVLRNMDAAPPPRSRANATSTAPKLVRDHRGRFGFFAALPMPDIEGGLHEIAYALDTLKADGIGLLTSYGDKWLGDPAVLPDHGGAQPPQGRGLHAPDRRQLLRQPACAGVPPVMIEFGTDTTRTIARACFNGNARRFRDIRWIFSHAGGTMPFLIERFVRHPILVPSTSRCSRRACAAELQPLLLRHRAGRRTRPRCRR